MGLGSGIRDLGSGIWKKPIPDPGESRGQKGTGSRIRIRNTVLQHAQYVCNIYVYTEFCNKKKLSKYSIARHISFSNE
jgi:hypothetical protein